MRDVDFSPDGRWLVTAGPQTAALWDARSGDRLFYLYGHAKPLTAVAFDQSGRLIATGGADGQVRFYRCELCVTDTELLAAAQRRLRQTGRTRTAAERATYLDG